MNNDTLQEVLRKHRAWLAGAQDGYQANLCGAYLREANLCGAYLREANLYGAYLREANLREANLCEANLCEANLCEANLRGADLRGADLREANLCGVDLREANLCGVNLRGVDLREANLCGVNLREANLCSPTVVLLAWWGECSDALTIKLMRYDAANHPDRKAFLTWAKGGPCPYNDVKVQRAARFQERRELYKPGTAPSAYTLMVELIREHCKDSDYHDKHIEETGEEVSR